MQQKAIASSVRDSVAELIEQPDMPLDEIPYLAHVADDLESFTADPEFAEHNAVTRAGVLRALRRIDRYLGVDEDED